jgi:hypothetical protein
MFNDDEDLLNTKFKIQDPIPIENLFQSEEMGVGLGLSKMFCNTIAFGILSLTVPFKENFPAEKLIPIDDHT